MTPASEGYDALLAVAARYAASPHFPDAIRSYVAGVARFREGSLLSNKLIATDIRWRIIGYLLYLDADRERFGPEGGATFGALLDICRKRQEAGPRLLRTLITLLRLAGFVQAVRSSQDGRETLLRPTERMAEFVRTWLGYGVHALDIVDPEAGWQAAFDADGDLIRRFLVSGGRDHLAKGPLASLMPQPLSSLLDQAGAFSVVLAVWMADDRGCPSPSRAAIGTRYGLSKTQVTNVISVGSKAGLFETEPKGGPRPTALLRTTLTSWVAIELAYYAQHMRAPVSANDQARSARTRAA